MRGTASRFNIRAVALIWPLQVLVLAVPTGAWPVQVLALAVPAVFWPLQVFAMVVPMEFCPVRVFAQAIPTVVCLVQVFAPAVPTLVCLMQLFALAVPAVFWPVQVFALAIRSPDRGGEQWTRRFVGIESRGADVATALDYSEDSRPKVIVQTTVGASGLGLLAAGGRGTCGARSRSVRWSRLGGRRFDVRILHAFRRRLTHGVRA